MYLSLFDSDLQGQTVNRCEVYHFHIYIEGDMELPLEANNAHMKGVFMHEYIHYIQHLTTLCGVMLSRMHNMLFCNYRAYFADYNEIPIPLTWRMVSPEMQQFFDSFDKTKGNRTYRNRLDEIRVSQDEINSARKEGRAVRLDTYNEETNQWTKKDLNFGYYAIIESMADLIQRIYEPEVNHDAVPYLIVQKLCKAYYPEVADDSNMMIALCTCALMSSNPGIGFFKAAEFAKTRRGLNGAELYHAFVAESTITLKNNTTTTIVQWFERQFTDYDRTLEQALGVADYYREAFESALRYAQSGENLLLMLLYDESVTPDQYFDYLKNAYGTPYIEAYNQTFCPGRESMPMDVVAAVGLELLFKGLSCNNNTNCPRIDSCTRQAINSYDCINGNQWYREQQCPFKAAMHFFGLEGKTFVRQRT